MRQHKLLDITSVYTGRDSATLRVPTQALLSALSRDFVISLAVVGSGSLKVLNLRQILSEVILWQALNEGSQRIGSSLLPYHEVSHSMRRLLKRVES